MNRLIAGQDWNSLVPHLEQAGVDAASTLEQLRRFARALIEWNRGASNLVSGADEARIVERHLLESIAPAGWIGAGRKGRWMDLGSGGGFPAIPLAMCGIGERWTLVESRRTKTLFLRKMFQEFELKNVEVVNDRIENLIETPGLVGEFDGFTSRATLKLVPTLDNARHFVRIGGEAFLWKGSGREHELRDETGWRRHWRCEGLTEIGSGLTVVCRFIRES